MDAIDSPYIIIESPDNFPADILAKDVAYLESLNCTANLRENQLFGRPLAMSWFTLGTACIVYLTKPYFEAFLQEVGKEHYTLFKKWLVNHVLDRRRLKVVTVTSSKSPNKVTENNGQSRSISIRASIHSDVWVTVFVNNRVEDDVLSEALGQVLDELTRLNKELTDQGKDGVYRKVGKPKVALYLVMNTDNQCWDLLTQQQMLTREKKS